MKLEQVDKVEVKKCGIDGSTEHGNTITHAARAPKLPFFDENNDYMDSYIS